MLTSMISRLCKQTLETYPEPRRLVSPRHQSYKQGRAVHDRAHKLGPCKEHNGGIHHKHPCTHLVIYFHDWVLDGEWVMGLRKWGDASAPHVVMLKHKARALIMNVALRLNSKMCGYMSPIGMGCKHLLLPWLCDPCAHHLIYGVVAFRSPASIELLSVKTTLSCTVLPWKKVVSYSPLEHTSWHHCHVDDLHDADRIASKGSLNNGRTPRKSVRRIWHR